MNRGLRRSGRRVAAWRKMNNPCEDYKSISDYGIIGDSRTCALVGIDGSIDWYCIPRFDSPSVFGALLDSRKGGRFKIAPSDRVYHVYQHYAGLTNVLVTEFRCDKGRFKVTDFMPCFKAGRQMAALGEIHRIVTGLEGECKFSVEVSPRPNYGGMTPTVNKVGQMGYAFTLPEPSVRQETALLTKADLRTSGGSLLGDLTICKDEMQVFVYRYGSLRSHHSSDTYTEIKLNETLNFWRRWISGCTYRGRWRDRVLRSALTLKLLVYSPTGAVVAAATTSLPEKIGGVRNWDYRYSWIRDSSFVLWAFESLGHGEEVENYLGWLESVFHLTGGNLQIMLGLAGERDLSEQEMKHLSGYRGSYPVRTGNGAWTQFQLDVYGILLDAVYFSHKYNHKKSGGGLTREVFNHFVKPLVLALEEDWKKPDSGIWEVRGEKKHFVYSKMWSWVGFDRAAKIALDLNYLSEANRWMKIRDKIRREIIRRGWNKEKKAFVRSYDSMDLDAANLLMPQVRFISARDPKMYSTIERTTEELTVGDDLVYRYKAEDGLPGGEGAFLMCSFWLVNCLSMAGKVNEASRLLERLIARANHLGLYSEEVDPETGEFLGNFPQAFTHMGLITAAISLNKKLAFTGKS